MRNHASSRTPLRTRYDDARNRAALTTQDEVSERVESRIELRRGIYRSSARPQSRSRPLRSWPPATPRPSPQTSSRSRTGTDSNKASSTRGRRGRIGSRSFGERSRWTFACVPVAADASPCGRSSPTPSSSSAWSPPSVAHATHPPRPEPRTHSPHAAPSRYGLPLPEDSPRP